MQAHRALLICLVLSLLPVISSAEERGLSALAVQNREHTMVHEFGVAYGTLPIDAFTKGMTLTGAYTVHFSDILAWEVGQFTWSWGIDTHLEEELENFELQPTEFEIVKYFATSSLVFKPLYGKLALLNRALLFGEIFIVAGAGWGKMSITNRTIANIGAGMRLYAGRFVSFRVDVRDYIFITRGDAKNELWLGLSVCLGLGRRKSQ